MTTVPTIVCFGDSNTHGTCPMRDITDIRRFGPTERWPGVVQQRLGARVRIIEEGHPGRTSLHDDPVEGGNRSGLAALQVVVESHRPIDAIVVMLGTNDLKLRFGVSAWEIALSVQQVVARALNSNCGPGNGPISRALIIAPPVLLERGFAQAVFAGANAKSRDFAFHFANAAEILGTDFLDAATVVQSDPLDGVHLSAESHRALGLAVADRLAAILGLAAVIEGALA